jgi:hypothetical protein
MSDAAKKSYIKKHGSAPNVAGDDDYDMGEVPGSRELDDTPEDDSEKGSSLTSAPGRVPDEDDEDDWGKKPDGDVDPDKFFKDRDKAKGLVKGKRQGRTGKELDQETLTIDGKQFRRISEGVEKQPKPTYEFSNFYKRFKK